MQLEIFDNILEHTFRYAINFNSLCKYILKNPLYKDIYLAKNIKNNTISLFKYLGRGRYKIIYSL